MPKTARAVYLLLGGAAVGLLCSASAHADPTILAPGNTDNSGDAYVAQLADTGQLPSEFYVAQYPADIWPKEPLRMDDATNIGADVAESIYDQVANGRPVTCRGFSEGTAVCLKLAQRRPVNLVLDGDPYGSTGFFNNPLAQAVEPVVNALGIPTDLPEPPGTVRNYSKYDIWANGGPQNVVGLINQGARLDEHSVQNPNDPHLTFVRDGVVNNVYDVDGNPVVNDGLAPEPPSVDQINGL